MTENYSSKNQELLSPPRVLIVEDEFLGATGLENSLKRMGYHVAGIAVTGEKAVDMASTKNPDIILMDIDLGDGMDGISAAEIINKKLKIPVLFLTANYNDSILRRALESNPYGYLNKPVRPVELKTAIETALHKHNEIESEKKINFSQKKFGGFLNKVSQGVMVISPDMEIIRANSAVSEITGFSPSEIIGKEFGNIFGDLHKDGNSSCPPDFNPVLRSFKTGNPEREMFGFYSRKDGSCHWVIATAVPQEAGNGGIIRESLLILEDITDLKSGGEYFSRIFEILSVPVAVIDIDRRIITDANPVFLSNFGYLGDETVGKAFFGSSFFADDYEKQAFYDAVLNNGRLRNMPVKAISSNGKIKSGYLSAEIITIGNKKRALITFIEKRENYLFF
ncbi:MAG: response regulator [Methanomicrobium sp.]|nr:response regulator [Methanomicrobium sp.]